MDMCATVHIEIPARDRLATAKFYAEIFGWKFQDYPGPVLFQTGNTVGGYPELSEFYRPGDVLICVDSNDLEADLKQIEARGGTVIARDMEMPGGGHLAFFSDPAGNRIALWKADPHQ